MKKEVVLVISWVLAIASSFFVPISKDYISYIHWDTISLTLILIITMDGFKKTGVVKLIGEKLLNRASSLKMLEAILIILTYFFSMIVSNDVALISFVPFAILTLKMAGKEKHTIYVVALLTVAANLGAMLTPIGNPHNIYFYLLSGYSIGEFLKITVPFSVFGFVILLALIFVRKNEEIARKIMTNDNILDKKTSYYVGLFIIALLSLTKVVPLTIVCLGVIILTLIVDRNNLKTIDYSLIFIFIGFFIFVGNFSRIEFVTSFIPKIIEGREFITSILCSQVMCNIPTSILLSGFSTNYKALILGADIGGMGTIISSMANIISYKAIQNEYENKKGRYILVFTGVSSIFLILEYILFTILY